MAVLLNVSTQIVETNHRSSLTSGIFNLLLELCFSFNFSPNFFDIVMQNGTWGKMS